MCGRYTLKSPKKLSDRFKAKTEIQSELAANYNVAPTQTMPIIVSDEDGNKRIELMRWGIPRHLSKDIEKMLINTKSESAFSPFWKKYVMTKRILVPATSFFEWKLGVTPKTPFLIHPKEDELFAFAGIWSTWEDKDGNNVNVYSIMTTEPNKEMRELHNRMPVILHPEDEDNWLSPAYDNDRNTIEALLRPYEDNGLEIYETSRDVNSPRNNRKDLLDPVAA